MRIKQERDRAVVAQINLHMRLEAAGFHVKAVAAQQQFALWWVQTWWKVAMGGWMNPPSLQHLSNSAQQRLFDSMLDVTSRGMAPVKRRAVANARRLNRATR